MISFRRKFAFYTDLLLFWKFLQLGFSFSDIFTLKGNRNHHSCKNNIINNKKTPATTTTEKSNKENSKCGYSFWADLRIYVLKQLRKKLFYFPDLFVFEICLHLKFWFFKKSFFHFLKSNWKRHSSKFWA